MQVGRVAVHACERRIQKSVAEIHEKRSNLFVQLSDSERFGSWMVMKVGGFNRTDLIDVRN